MDDSRKWRKKEIRFKENLKLCRKRSKKASKEINKIVKLEFEQSSLALKKAKEIQSKLKHHQLIDVETSNQTNKKAQQIYKIACKLVENREIVDEIKNQSGRFILATNILSETELASAEILGISWVYGDKFGLLELA